MGMVFILAFLTGALTLSVVLLGANLIADAIQRKKDAQLLINHRLESVEEKLNKIQNKKRGK